MLHTRVIVTGFTKRGSSRTVDRGAKFRDEADIQRVTDEIVAQLKPFYDEIKVTTREAG